MPRAIVPIVARAGDNVTTRSTNMRWYSGATILDVLHAFEPNSAEVLEPLRFPVQDVYRFDERCIIVGRIESGTLHVGQRLVFLPSQQYGTVNTIERWNAELLPYASAGDSIGVTLNEQLFLNRGDIAAS